MNTTVIQNLDKQGVYLIKNTSNCAKNQINSYKNLVFKYNTAPLNSNIQKELGEFRETPEVDNPELSL